MKSYEVNENAWQKKKKKTSWCSFSMNANGRKTQITQLSKNLDILSLHTEFKHQKYFLLEKAGSILKLPLEKSCTGTGRVINWLQARVSLCQDSGMSFVGSLLWTPSTPTRCEFWTESCIFIFSLWPYLQPGSCNNISPQEQSLLPTMINLCPRDIFKMSVPKITPQCDFMNSTISTTRQTDFSLLLHEFFSQKAVLHRLKIIEKKVSTLKNNNKLKNLWGPKKAGIIIAVWYMPRIVGLFTCITV